MLLRNRSYRALRPIERSGTGVDMVTGTEHTFAEAVVLLGVILLAWLFALRRPLSAPCCGHIPLWP